MRAIEEPVVAPPSHERQRQDREDVEARPSRNAQPDHGILQSPLQHADAHEEVEVEQRVGDEQQVHDAPEEPVHAVQLPLVRLAEETLQWVPRGFDAEQVLPGELRDGDVAEGFRHVHVVVARAADDQEQEPAGVDEAKEVGLRGAEFGGEGRVEEPRGSSLEALERGGRCSGGRCWALRKVEVGSNQEKQDCRGEPGSASGLVEPDAASVELLRRERYKESVIEDSW